MKITDEMVEKAAEAMIARYIKTSDDPMHTESRMRMRMPDARAALEAVAPMLIAQGMREAAKLCHDDFCGERADELGEAILDRAQELDPK